MMALFASDWQCNAPQSQKWPGSPRGLGAAQVIGSIGGLLLDGNEAAGAENLSSVSQRDQRDDMQVDWTGLQHLFELALCISLVRFVGQDTDWALRAFPAASAAKTPLSSFPCGFTVFPRQDTASVVCKKMLSRGPQKRPKRRHTPVHSTCTPSLSVSLAKDTALFRPARRPRSGSGGRR